MGHLLYQHGRVDQRQMQKFKKESAQSGKSSSSFAWIMDTTDEERERGITVDFATNYFETDHHIFTILDAPGHKDFVPNMIAGAAEADMALLVVDASTGEFESGFQRKGQTKEHALLIHSLGLPQIIVAVNKLDTVDWSETRFTEVSDELREYLLKIGFEQDQIHFVPIGGLSGENLRSTSEDKLLKWYKGPTLIHLLDNIKYQNKAYREPLLVSLYNVQAGAGAVLVHGLVHRGIVENGDKVRCLSADQIATVKGKTQRIV